MTKFYCTFNLLYCFVQDMRICFFFCCFFSCVCVFEQKAKEFGYDQSLMARLCKNLHPSNPQLSPILLLSVQYRMHPDICEFPSKYIYNSALQNDWYAHTSLSVNFTFKAFCREGERWECSEIRLLTMFMMCRQGQCREYDQELWTIAKSELRLLRSLRGPCMWWVLNTMSS